MMQGTVNIKKKIGTIPCNVQRFHCLDQNNENLNFLTSLGSTYLEDGGIIILRNVAEYSPVITTALYNPNLHKTKTEVHRPVVSAVTLYTLK